MASDDSTPSRSTLQILCHDGPCIVVNKPHGVLTQAPPGIDSVEAQVRAYVKQLEHKQGKIYLGVPHRLDRPVTGALVFARHVRAATRITQQFEKRTARKVYWAMVTGEVAPPRGVWHDYVYKLPDRAAVEIVSADHEAGRYAELTYRLLACRRGHSLLEIVPTTGRTHQIRVQAATRGWPVLGDETYGSPEPFGPFAEDPRDRAIALHARELGIRHPTKDARVHVTAPLPHFWQSHLPGEFGQAEYMP